METDEKAVRMPALIIRSDEIPSQDFRMGFSFELLLGRYGDPAYCGRAL
jgi:hypothetical protein